MLQEQHQSAYFRKTLIFFLKAFIDEAANVDNNLSISEKVKSHKSLLSKKSFRTLWSLSEIFYYMSQIFFLPFFIIHNHTSSNKAFILFTFMFVTLLIIGTSFPNALSIFSAHSYASFEIDEPYNTTGIVVSSNTTSGLFS